MTIPDYAGLCAQVKAEFPKFKTVYKKDSWAMRALSRFMVSTFMVSFVTTIVNTVYLPSNWDAYDDAEKCSLLRHERVHMRQARKLTFPVFMFLYLLVFFPVGLAYCRARFEMEAYTESLAAFKDYGIDYNSNTRRAWLKKQFVTGAYAWMWPFPETIDKWFDKAVTKASA
jgi:hypothetical protein